MPTIPISIPEKLQVLFQDYVLGPDGQPLPELDDTGNQLYEIGADGKPTDKPKLVRIRNVYMKGGRGGAKSMSMGQFVAFDLLVNGNQWLLAREIQDSIKDSSYKEVKDGAVMLGIDNYFRFQNDKIVCTKNNAEVLFSGLRYVSDSVKSKKGIMRVWVEEADKVSERSIETLTPTIRAPGSRIFWTYNPNHESDPVHQRALHPGPRDIVVNINWRDNPWFPEVLRYELEQMRRTNFRKYLKVYEGMTEEQSGETKFMPQWKRQWKNRATISGNLYLLCDPAGTGNKTKNSDYTVFVAIVAGSDNNYYVLEWVRDRMTLSEKWNTLLSLYKKYLKEFGKVSGVGYEKYGMQSDVEYFKEKMEDVGVRFQITQLGGIQSKTARMERLTGPYSEGRFYTPPECEYRQKDGKTVDLLAVYEREISMFPFIPDDVHDDMMDVTSRIMDKEMNVTFPTKNSRVLLGESTRRKKLYSDPARYGFEEQVANDHF